jgi:hypothetical protein
MPNTKFAIGAHVAWVDATNRLRFGVVVAQHPLAEPQEGRVIIRDEEGYHSQPPSERVALLPPVDSVNNPLHYALVYLDMERRMRLFNDGGINREENLLLGYPDSFDRKWCMSADDKRFDNERETLIALRDLLNKHLADRTLTKATVEYDGLGDSSPRSLSEYPTVEDL